ncbi:MAG TPA: ATP-binding protein [Terracidiphilus sp.]|jgi:two-component system sensor histidine kinase KdpD|nr:ATP-binding protein [Terracidiphilus sp.]
MASGSQRAKQEQAMTRWIARWIGATAFVATVDVLLTLAHMKETAAGLVFLTLVVGFATRAGFATSLYVAVLCAISFDYFFLPPVHTFRLAGVQEWIEMLSFLASSAVVGRLAERARRHTRQAQQRREDVERLYALSQEMMLHEDANRLIRELPKLIQRCFALDEVVLYVTDYDQFYATMAEVPPSVEASLRTQTQGHGPTLSGPGGFLYLALMLGLKPIGALAWKPDRLSREVATPVGAQVSIALTRALAIEAFTRVEASREGERLRTALVDSLTHELRTPLTSIRAAATTLTHEDALDEPARRDLASLIDEESTRLDKLIGEAVEMAEMDARVLHVHSSPLQARALLDQVVEDARSALGAHRVVIAVEEPDAPAWFDAHLLGRVLRHLLENAARYSPPGSRIVLRSWRGTGRLEFSVEDNGSGIDAADLPYIFDKFYRGRKAAGKGSGMGLAIARAILELHGGGIDVASTPGQGTTFRFWVPLAEREPSSASSPDAERPHPGT